MKKSLYILFLMSACINFVFASVPNDVKRNSVEFIEGAYTCSNNDLVFNLEVQLTPPNEYAAISEERAWRERLIVSVTDSNKVIPFELGSLPVGQMSDMIDDRGEISWARESVYIPNENNSYLDQDLLIEFDMSNGQPQVENIKIKNVKYLLFSKSVECKNATRTNTWN